MDGIPPVVWVAGGVSVVVIVVVYVIFVLQRRRVDLTHSRSLDQKPEWMRTTPPSETVAATQARGEGIGLYGRDPGERFAVAFAEQIEDIVHARLSEDPTLSEVKVDFETAPTGELEIWVDGESYTDVGSIPNERVREIIRQAVESWGQGG
jgi:heme exporter protein D